MARIRSIHPNTPTDPDLAAIPIPGRLLFIYSWTIADDAGNLERSPRGMKMALFPGDESMTVKKIEKIVDALIEGRFYLPYEVDGKAFLHVRSFKKYQKIDHPTGPRFPLAPDQTYVYHERNGNSWISKTVNASDSTNVPRTDGEHTPNVRAGREGKGKEGKGLEGNGGVRGTDGEHADGPRPLGGAGAAAYPPGNGGDPPKASGKERLPREAAISAAIARIDCGEWTNEQGVENLISRHDFTQEEARAALGMMETMQ